MNIAKVSGTVQGDVTTRTFKNDRGDGHVATIRLAIGNGRGGHTYINVIAWHDQARKVNGLGAGAKLEVHGFLSKGRDWTDRQGNKRYGEIEVVGEDIIILDEKTGEPTSIDDGNRSVASIKFD